MNLIQRNTTIIGTYDSFQFGLSDLDRARNVHILGKTGTGKTKLIYSMVIQDIYNRKPFVLFDFWGDAENFLLEKISPYNIDQVYYIYPNNIENFFGVSYSDFLSVKKDQLAEKFCEYFRYRLVLDERIGVVVDTKLDHFVSSRHRDEFIDLITSGILRELESRIEFPQYRKPLFTFYFDELQHIKVRTLKKILDNLEDYNCCIVSANQSIKQISDEVLEEIFLMYGNYIFTRISDDDVSWISRKLKYIHSDDLLKLNKGEAAFCIFSGNEKQREFIANIYFVDAKTFNLASLAKTKDI